jgi:hypothetical protein
MNAAAYIDILENHLELDGLYNRDLVFQDDNAPCHRARIVTAWIDERWDHLEWPPHSLDLSPIRMFGPLSKIYFGEEGLIFMIEMICGERPRELGIQVKLMI